jgi:DNA-binding GntR family transcriptional regulator
MSVESTGKSGRGRESYSDRAYRELKRKILDGQMTVGEQHMEQDVAAMLGMSRTPTREALIRLANEGLVEVRPRHGMQVKPVSVEDMREIYEILTALESAAAGLAAEQRLTEQQIGALREAVSDMDVALESGDLEAWARADERFHRLLLAYSGNVRLEGLVGTFIDQAHRVRMLTLRLRPKPEASNDDHRAVVEAIAKGDADTARRVHWAHRERSGRMLVALLETHRLTRL